MNKFLKLGTVLSMAGVLVFSTTGCSCSMKQDKINCSGVYDGLYVLFKL